MAHDQVNLFTGKSVTCSPGTLWTINQPCADDLCPKVAYPLFDASLVGNQPIAQTWELLPISFEANTETARSALQPSNVAPYSSPNPNSDEH